MNLWCYLGWSGDFFTDTDADTAGDDDDNNDDVSTVFAT